MLKMSVTVIFPINSDRVYASLRCPRSGLVNPVSADRIKNKTLLKLCRHFVCRCVLHSGSHKRHLRAL